MRDSKASLEAQLTLSDEKLLRYRPCFYGWRGMLMMVWNFIGPPMSGTPGMIRAYLQDGDAGAAILLELDPPLVAAYSEDLDAVTLLTFPAGSTDVKGMKSGQRLVSVSTYRHPDQKPEADLLRGPGGEGAWSDFDPLVGDFLSDDISRLDALRRMIPEHQWNRCSALIDDYKHRNPAKARDGRAGMGGLRSLFQRDSQTGQH